MSGRLRRCACLIATAAILAAGAGTAAGARAPSRAGTYSGAISQLVPAPFRGAVTLTVRGTTITKLSYKVSEICSNLIVSVLAQPTVPVHVAIARDGSFTYLGVLSGTSLQLRGRIRGRSASGTLFAALAGSGQAACTMQKAAAFSASR